MLRSVTERHGAHDGNSRSAGHLTVVRTPRDPAGREDFARRVVEHLARHEAENNLPVGVASAVADGSFKRDDLELLLALDDAGESVAAIVMTPPYRALVAHGDDQAGLETLLTDLLDRGVRVPGVVGPEPTSGWVNRWWKARTGTTVTVGMRQGVYRLATVTPAPRTPGHVREATSADEAVLLPWLSAFFAEVHLDVGSPEESWRAFTSGGYRRLHVFEVGGEPVSIAGVGARTPHGRRIGPVYTPPERRGRGYAEALVAEVSGQLLEAGNDFCFLFTDLDNPTSNAVYERIGYEMVITSTEYDFVASSPYSPT